MESVSQILLDSESTLFFIFIQLHLNWWKHDNLNETRTGKIRLFSSTQIHSPIINEREQTIAICFALQFTWFHGTNTVRVIGWNGERWNCNVTAPPPLTRTSNLKWNSKKNMLNLLHYIQRIHRKRMKRNVCAHLKQQQQRHYHHENCLKTIILNSTAGEKNFRAHALNNEW